VSPNIKKQANLRLPLNVEKLEAFQLPGGFALLTDLLTRASVVGILLINTVLLHYDLVYHF